MYSNAIVNGLMNGGLYAGVAVGLSLVFGISNLLNLAQGAFIVFGAYGAYLLQHALGIHPFVGLWIVAVAAFVLGFVVYRVGGLARVAQRSLLMVLVFTFGLDLVLINAIAYAFGGSGKSLNLPQTFYTSWAVGNVVIPVSHVIVAVCGVAMTVLVDLLVKRTKVGRGIRATRQDRDMAAMNGVDVTAAVARTFGLGAATAAIAGVLIAFAAPFQPGMDPQYLVIAFAVAIIGGLGRVDGAIAGGLLFGLTLSVMSTWLGSGNGEAATFGLLFVLLLVRPQGVLGSEYY